MQILYQKIRLSLSLETHSKNEECKISYGSRFDRMKKNHKRLKTQFLREEKGAKKELKNKGENMLQTQI